MHSSSIEQKMDFRDSRRRVEFIEIRPVPELTVYMANVDRAGLDGNPWSDKGTRMQSFRFASTGLPF